MSASDPSASKGHGRSGVFELRDATVADAEAIESVHWSARAAVYEGRVSDWPPSGPDRAGRIERWTWWLSSPEITCIVADGEDGIVGFVTLRASEDDDADPTVVEMPTLYVDPTSWRRGIGKRLCDAAVERSRAEGFLELTLWVLRMNDGARRFYAAYGFEADGATKVDEGTRERLVAERYRLSLRG